MEVVLSRILDVVERALNAAIGTDPDTLARLGAMQGRVIAVDLQALERSIYVLPLADRIRLQVAHEGPVDVRIRGTPLALLRLATARAKQQATFSGEVEIIGDLALSQLLQSLLRGLDIDWEELLSQKVGDVVARQLGNVVRSFGQWGQQVKSTLESDVADFLRHEVRLLPERLEVENFLDSVDTLRADTDRLEQRVKRLKGLMGEPNDG